MEGAAASTSVIHSRWPLAQVNLQALCPSPTGRTARPELSMPTENVLSPLVASRFEFLAPACWHSPTYALAHGITCTPCICSFLAQEVIISFPSIQGFIKLRERLIILLLAAKLCFSTSHLSAVFFHFLCSRRLPTSDRGGRRRQNLKGEG